MAHSISAKKRIRQNEKHRQRESVHDFPPFVWLAVLSSCLRAPFAPGLSTKYQGHSLAAEAKPGRALTGSPRWLQFGSSWPREIICRDDLLICGT